MDWSDRQAELHKLAQADVAARSRYGALVHPSLVLLMCALTDLGGWGQAMLAGGLGTTLCLAAVRLVLLAQKEKTRDQRRWSRLHLCILMSVSVFWGIFPALAVWIYAARHENASVPLLFTAAVSFFTVDSLVSEPRAIRPAVFVLVIPPLAVLLVTGAPGRWTEALAILVFAVHLCFRGPGRADMYWRHLSNHYDVSVMAHRDFLTSLPNRLCMDQELEKSVAEARRGNGQLALLYIDLDGFKQINDRLSHRAGDLYLREVARRLVDCSQESLESGPGANALAARLGGDEFTILVRGCGSVVAARQLAERVLRAASTPFTIEGHSVACSASIGVSLFPTDGDMPENLVRAADRAMYAAKHSGKNRICFAGGAAEVELDTMQLSLAAPLG